MEVRKDNGLRVYRHLGQRRLGSRRYSATDRVFERKVSGVPMTPRDASNDAIKLGSICSRGYDGTRHEGEESEATRAVAAKTGLHYKDSLKAWGGTWIWELQTLPEDLG